NQILYTPTGKPRVAIFSIAHLGDSERMFFVSLLLNQILGWMRTKSGTTSLRAIVYMDEIFGYFPPVANPPSKTPLLTLLKQARAYGVGMVLATQNPVDLDYKGLSNTGTWFIGRLQTERDKARVLDGLEGAAATTGSKFDRRRMEETMAGLGSRIFLMTNVHDDEPVIFETRWAMSYLRGPLTRNQIKLLMEPLQKAPGAAVADSAAGMAQQPVRTVAAPAPAAAGAMGQRPVLPPSVAHYFVPIRSGQPAAADLIYEPALISAAEVHFAQAKTGVNQLREVSYMTPMVDGPIAIEWDAASELQLNINDLETQGMANASYTNLPRLGSKAESYTVWKGDFVNWLYRTQKVDLWRSPGLKEVSNAGETERDFRIRLGQKAREQRDAMADKLRVKYAAKIATAQEQLRRAGQVVDREKEQAKQEKMQTAISLGATVLGAFLGKKAVSASSMGRAATTARGVSRSMRQSQDVGRAQETVAAVQQKLQLLEADFKAETDALVSKIDPLTETLEEIAVRPAKKDISVKL
ncbi:MAG: ATP-binding protein, partial [Gammaproteobacteria bacterium]|nr:ATP-binding protein [Gammaproteobacteria bacterium]